jgi:hypothetical protein
VSQNHIERLIVPWEPASKSIKIGAVPDVGLLDFNQEVVVFEVAEPIDPPNFDLLAEFAIV